MTTVRCFPLLVILVASFPVHATEPAWQLMEWSDQRLESRADEKTGIYDDTRGVHVTNDGISNWSICSDAVMTHEFGHNLGAWHQRVNPEQEGFNYAHVVPDILNTVMSSFGSADRNRYQRMNVFSNPDFNCGNAPCGSSVAGEEANNSQILRDFSPVVADYTAPVYPGMQARPAPSLPDSDGDGDGIDDWNDPFPFDPYDGNPPPAPEPPGYVIPPLFDGSAPDHFELLVASSGNDQVHAYSMQGEWQGMVVQAETLPFPDKRPALSEFTRMSVAEDGLVYMLSSASVRQFDRITQAEIDVFLDSQPPFTSPGSLVDGFPRSMRFSPDQSQLMVLGNGNIQTYNSAANLITYRGGLPLASDPGTFQHPVRMRDIDFDGSGKHYIIDDAARQIAIFNGPLTADYSGDLDFARDLAFGPDGNLFVISRANNAVLRFDGNNGSFIDAFVPAGSQGLDQPQSLVFAQRIGADIFRDRFESAANPCGEDGCLEPLACAEAVFLELPSQENPILIEMLPNCTGDPQLCCPNGVPVSPCGPLAVDLQEYPGDEPRLVATLLEPEARLDLVLRARLTTVSPVPIRISGTNCELDIHTPNGADESMRNDATVFRVVSDDDDPHLLLGNTTVTGIESADLAITGPILCGASGLEGFVADAVADAFGQAMTGWFCDSCPCPEP